MIRYKFEREDCAAILRVQRGQHFYGILFLLSPFIGITLLIFGLIGCFLGLPHVAPWTIVAIAGFLLLISTPILTFVQCSRRSINDTDVSIDDQGVELTTNSITTHYVWADFSHFEETKRHFLLFSPKPPFIPGACLQRSEVLIVPKRALSAEGLTTIQKLLRVNVRPPSAGNY